MKNIQEYLLSFHHKFVAPFIDQLELKIKVKQNRKRKRI